MKHVAWEIEHVIILCIEPFVSPEFICHLSRGGFFKNNMRYQVESIMKFGGTIITDDLKIPKLDVNVISNGVANMKGFELYFHRIYVLNYKCDNF